MGTYGFAINTLDDSCGTASGHPIRYADGAAIISGNDFLSDGSDMASTLSRSWSNVSYSADRQSVSFGNGFSFDGLPYLQNISNTYSMYTPEPRTAFIVISSSTSAYGVFQGYDDSYVNAGGNAVKKNRFKALGDEIEQISPDGSEICYADFSGNWPTAEQGKIVSRTTAAGDTMTYNWSSDGSQLESINYDYATHAGSTDGTANELFNFSYAPGSNQVSEVVQSRNGVPVRTVEYSYYGSGDANGNAGDLKYVTERNGDELSPVVNTSYYRWYTSDSSTGYTEGLKLYMGDEAYQKAVHDYGSAAAVESAADTGTGGLTNYADNYFQYNTSHQVTEEIAQGSSSGCSCGRTGEGTYTFSYATNPNANSVDSLNGWMQKTTETLPDGSQNIVYTNSFGDVVFKVVVDPVTGKQYYSWNRYDDDGELALQASGNSISGYSESFDDLVGYQQSGTYLTSTGRIDVSNYFTSANDGGNATLDDYEQSAGYQLGPSGTFIPTESWTYTDGGVIGDGIWNVATDTTYPNASDLSDTRVTSYTYDSWWQVDGVNTLQPQQVTTSLPEVDASENGPDSGSGASSTLDQTQTYYDSAGRVVWSVDAAGYINYYQYDPLTGAQIEEVQDVDPSTITTAAVAGPTRSTSLPAALNLTTTTVVDSQGRPTKVTDPKGNITYTVYDDTTADGDPRKVITYKGWNSTTDEPTGPITAELDDPATGIHDTISYTWSGTGGVPVDANGVPTGAELTGSDVTSSNFTLLTLTRQKRNVSNQVVESDRYFDLAGLTYDPTSAAWATFGAVGTNYYATKYKYNSGAHLYQTTSADGTITMQVIDARGLSLSTWVGTNNTGATETDPTGGGATGNNMIETEADTYDADGNLIQQEKFPGGGATPRVTLNYYDFRDRLVASKSGVLLNGDGSENTSGETSAAAHGLINYTIYDNLSEPIEQDTYAGDGVAITSTDGVPNPPSSSLLRANEGIDFDDQGRVYRTSVYSVNPTNGDVSSDSIDTNTWYDLRGNVMKTQKTGQAATKTAYDGADRPTIVYTTDAGGDAAAGTSGNWSDAGNVTGDTVLEQDETVYDADSNPIETIQRNRFNTDTGTGALAGPTDTNAARVYYTASFYDAGNRLTATANYGTNGGSTLSLPSSVPSRSDTILVTSYTYNPAGWVNETTDPRGIITKDDYDALGRTTHTIADFTDGTPTNSTNQTTAYTYDGDDHVITQTAVLPDGAEEETGYIYGVTTAAGSEINSNDILAAADYPDLTTGEASTDEEEDYTVDALGERTSLTDRDGNVHTYSYDVLGRQTLDAVTTLGDGVDGSIRAIGAAYNSAGQAYLHTSYSNAAGTTVANQDEDIYNGLGQLIGEYQAISGAVNTSSTPEVQYGYSTLENGSRKSDIIYPNGRQIDYNYASGLDSSISRLTSESDDSTGTVLESYIYLGLGTVVERDHPQVGVNLTYISSTGSTGDGGDQYTGLDRFGRVVDQKWVNSSGTAVDEYQYGYDRDGNVLYKLNDLSAGNSELYSYDDLNRLITFDRGTLATGDASISGTPTREIDYTLDALGNQITVTTNGTAVGQTYNAQNELIGGSLAYDANGNMAVDQYNLAMKYDAWNRQTSAVPNTHTNLQHGGLTGSARYDSYEYDAFGRRIEDGFDGHGTYYDGWQAIQGNTNLGALQYQYVWSPVYINAMVERDAGSTRLYVTQDANWNTTSIVNASGSVVERYQYDPYGAVSYLSDAFTTESTPNSSGWAYFFQGGRLDAEGQYWFEHRDEDAGLGSWAEQDPAGYVDGLSLTAVDDSSPVRSEDPDGTDPIVDNPGPEFPTGPISTVPPALPVVSGPVSGLGNFVGGGGNAAISQDLLNTLQQTPNMQYLTRNTDQHVANDALNDFSCCKGSSTLSESGGPMQVSTGLAPSFPSDEYYLNSPAFNTLGHNVDLSWTATASATKVATTSDGCCVVSICVVVQFYITKTYTFNTSPGGSKGGLGGLASVGTSYNMNGTFPSTYTTQQIKC